MDSIWEIFAEGRDHKSSEIEIISDTKFDLFENATRQAFENLKSKLDEIVAKSLEASKKITLTSDEKGVPTDNEAMDEVVTLLGEQYWTTQHLNTLSEMKIVYLFKSVEIAMKSLIRTAYPKTNTKDFYQWENMSAFLKNLNTNVSTLRGYLEVNELRKVNNNIKHTDVVSDEVKKINEFKGKEEFEFADLELFHGRVKEKSEQFIKDLGVAILVDLYTFDNARIESIAREYKNRMDAAELRKLAQILQR